MSGSERKPDAKRERDSAKQSSQGAAINEDERLRMQARQGAAINEDERPRMQARQGAAINEDERLRMQARQGAAINEDERPRMQARQGAAINEDERLRMQARQGAAINEDERPRMQARQGAAINEDERLRMQARQGAAINEDERLRMQARQGAAINEDERLRMQARQGAAINEMIRYRRDAGFSLAALIFFATAVSILLSAAVPAYQMQARREREEELIFRGQEYTRAIQKYHRKFSIYPPSIDALVQTNGLRFVRRLYTDPITGKEFRLISINPDGSVSGSTLFSQRANNVPLFGADTQVFGQQPPPPQPPPPTGNRGGQPPAPASNTGGQPLVPAGNRGGQPPSPSGNRGQPPPPGNNNAGVPLVTSGIIGVASNSSETSVMVYNNRQKYNEWEFVAILGQAGQTNTPANGAAPAQPLFPTQGNRQPEPQPLKRP